MTATAHASAAGERSLLRAVAVPSEHGGWGLTLEPVLLGLLVAPSFAGACIGVATFGAFLVRTPAKLVGVDLHRRRRLDRTRLAAAVASVESALIVAAVAGATLLAGTRWWVVVALAAPLAAVEAWYDVRSRGRRLVPELCGALGIAGSAAAIAIAGGAANGTAAAVWLVLAARSIGAIPFVRAQIARSRRGELRTGISNAAQAIALIVALAAWWGDHRVLPGSVVLAAIAASQLVWVRRTPPAVKVIGMRQMLLGLAVTLATAAGIALG